MRKTLVTFIVVAVLGIAQPVMAQTELDCGETVKRSVRLENNLLNCAGDGLVVGKGEIVIDLNGYTIAGKDGSDAGIFNEKGFKDVLIRDGQITGFDDGILIETKLSTGNVITDVVFDDNDVAISIDGADENLIEDNEFAGGNGDGISIVGHENVVEGNEIFDEAPAVKAEGDDNQITDNEIVYATAGDRGAAVLIEGDDNVIADNEILAGEDGIVAGGNENLIEDNDLEGGAGDGIVILGSDATVEGNGVEFYEGDGIVLTDDGRKNAVLDNELSENGGDGIHVESSQTRVEDNEADDNIDDGTEVAADDSRIVDNDADDNGDWGIRASGDGVEGSGNDADGNARTNQCSPVELCEDAASDAARSGGSSRDGTPDRSPAASP